MTEVEGKQTLSSIEWEEYKLLQGKIDNLGEFEFKIRGWAVTLTAGAFAAAKAVEQPTLLPGGLMFVLVMLGLFEISKTTPWKKAFINRINALERKARSAESGHSAGFVPAPAVARYIYWARKTSPISRRLMRLVSVWVFYGLLELFLLAGILGNHCSGIDQTRRSVSHAVSAAIVNAIAMNNGAVGQRKQQ